jgi:hypothetical protein
LDTDKDSIFTTSKFDVWHEATSTGNFSIVNKHKLRIPCLYVKGHIVYGGHLIVVADAPEPDPSEETKPDSLYLDFLERHAENISGIPVDTFKVRKR